METNNKNSEMQTYCNQIGPTAVFNKLMELQDLWTSHIKSVCDDYAKLTNMSTNLLTHLEIAANIHSELI